MPIINNKNEDKPTEKDYLEWLCNNDIDKIVESDKRYYDIILEQAKTQFIKSGFWQDLITNLNNFDEEYYLNTNYRLLAEKELDLKIKPYQSAINKTYRKNILLNSRWPDPPKSGWIQPSNCFCAINDCLRTSLIVKYLDGAEFVLEKLKSIAKKYSLKCEHDFEAKDSGYYAIHCYITENFEVESKSWEPKIINIKIEIQITTQIQNVIKQLTHEYYERSRSEMLSNNKAWQWDYKNDTFIVNYLGHVLHYIEGTIMEVRDKGRN